MADCDWLWLDVATTTTTDHDNGRQEQQWAQQHRLSVAAPLMWLPGAVMQQVAQAQRTGRAALPSLYMPADGQRPQSELEQHVVSDCNEAHCAVATATWRRCW